MKFLESLKEYVLIFSKRFENLFNFANSIIFAKSKNCLKHPEKICMCFLTNFKNFLLLLIFAISLLHSRKNSKYPRKYRSIFDWSNWGDVEKNWISRVNPGWKSLKCKEVPLNFVCGMKFKLLKPSECCGGPSVIWTCRRNDHQHQLTINK